jgi:hypothetical protein
VKLVAGPLKLGGILYIRRLYVSQKKLVEQAVLSDFRVEVLPGDMKSELLSNGAIVLKTSEQEQ